MTRRYMPIWRQAAPYRHGWRDHVRDVLTIARDTLAILVMFIAILVWVAIASASQVAP